MGLLPENWMEQRTSSVNTLQHQLQLPDMLVGSGYGDISGISNSVRSAPSGKVFADISNVSWMLQLENSNILMNNELGTDASSGELYIVNNSGVQTDSFNLMEQGLAGPVYFCKYKNNIYVACYGYWNDISSAGIFYFNHDNPIKSGTAYPSLSTSVTGHSNIHMIDIFKPADTKVNPFLLAVDLGAKCIYKINPDDGVHFNAKVYSFQHLFPRHFVQIPNTNYIALITERGADIDLSNNPNNKNQTLVIILEYNDSMSMFQKIDYDIDLGDEFIDKNNILKGITGAEIKYVNHSIYVTVRGYTEPYKNWQTKPENGLFVKLNVDENTGKLSLNSYIEVGKDPRYFTIQDNIAYVANHLGTDEYDEKNSKPGDIPMITLPLGPDMVLKKEDAHVVHPGNIYPVFILLQ